MSDLVQIEVGARPWSPGPDVKELHILDYYNIPLAGIIEQHGAQHFYVCAAGEEDRANVWLYSHIDAEEARALAATTGEQLVPIMAAALRNRMVVAALAEDGCILDHDRVDAGLEHPGVLVRRYLAKLRARMTRMNQRVHTLEQDPSLTEEVADEALIAM